MHNPVDLGNREDSTFWELFPDFFFLSFAIEVLTVRGVDLKLRENL